MLLVIDVGNTNTVFGLYRAETLIRSWRLGSDLERSAKEWGEALAAELAAGDVDPAGIRGAALCSVVPVLEERLQSACEQLLGYPPLLIDTQTDCGMPVRYDDPGQLGIDRLVNAVAAYAKKQGSLVVVDFGTATTFDHVSAAGEYRGGVIAPGLKISAEALHQRASRLPRVALRCPPRVIATSTVESMQAGIFFGYVGLVDGLVARIRAEAGDEPLVIATGGLATLVAPHSRSIDEVDEHLTLDGMRIIFERQRQPTP